MLSDEKLLKNNQPNKQKSPKLKSAYKLITDIGNVHIKAKSYNCRLRYIGINIGQILVISEVKYMHFNMTYVIIYITMKFLKLDSSLT